MAEQIGRPRRQKVVRGVTKYGQYDEPEAKPADPSPPREMVVAFHKNAPRDTKKEDIHHTLGPSPHQASPGDHTHNGSDSMPILSGYILTGSRSNWDTASASIINALVRLGATNNTTP